MLLCISVVKRTPHCDKAHTEHAVTPLAIANTVCTAQHQATRQQAEATLLAFRNSHNPLAACQHILQHSHSLQARFQARSPALQPDKYSCIFLPLLQCITAAQHQEQTETLNEVD